ncbi:MAG: hypothetical protein GVY13_05885 [Alphaproteobacteria bacterium]|nr:hypothetical protein [Alphaproteobacteria bacterium]
MPHWLTAAAVSALLAATSLTPAARAQIDVRSPEAEATDGGALSLRHVALSTGGVGYFEYEAVVTGDAALSLDVRLDQVDDVLKSLVVYDSAGSIGAISLPGREPLREAFRELPFGPAALASPAALLEALRGAAIRVEGPRDLAGRVLSVVEETVRVPEAGTVETRHRVSVMTDSGVRQFILEDTDSLEFTDPDLAGQVDAALAALARHGEQERRTLTARLSGEGERTVRLAYVVEVPLWKTAYRLTLPPAAAAEDEDAAGDEADRTAGLQGWAVLENLSGEDWEAVSLTILSGNPVTFRQALYQAYYVDRPEIPVEVFGRVLPRLDTGAVSPQPTGPAARAPEPMPAPAAEAAGVGMFDMARVSEGRAAASGAPADLARVTAADAEALTAQVLFRLPGPVSVASGDSLLVPFVSRDVPMERVALYQPDTHPRHPLASVRLENDGSTGLPPGVLTLYERRRGTEAVAYVGDARLDTVPAGEERLVSYAVDQAVTIDRESSDTRTIARGRIVDGLLELIYSDRARMTYTIAGAATENRLVVLEHPRRAGWDLVTPSSEEAEDRISLTENHIRIRVPVPAGETVSIEVVQERPRTERMQLLNLSRSQIGVYAEADRLSPDIREALAEIAEQSAAISEEESRLAELERAVADIDQDQGRIRRNLDSVPRDSDLYERYLDALSRQEDRLASLRREIARLRGSLESRRTALADYVRDLELR